MASKAQTLKKISLKKIAYKVPKLMIFTLDELYNPNKDINKEIDKFFSGFVAVRSSAVGEDSQLKSLAGEYESILNVPSNNAEEIDKAIERVILSYKDKRVPLPEDEVIIQEMAHNSTMSGVIFTYDLNTGAPYYVINYDDQSGLTDTVTSGEGEYSNRTLYVHRGSINELHSERFKKLLLAVQELEQVMDNKFLDIEFTLGQDLTPYLLQVRSITTQINWNRELTKRIDATLKGVELFVVEQFKKWKEFMGILLF